MYIYIHMYINLYTYRISHTSKGIWSMAHGIGNAPDVTGSTPNVIGYDVHVPSQPSPIAESRNIIYIHKPIHIYTYLYISIHIYIYIYTCLYISIHIYLFVLFYIYICLYMSIHIHTHICILFFLFYIYIYRFPTPKKTKT